MNLSELTQKMHEFVEAMGWYAPDSPKQQTPRALAISLSIEAAEVLEHVQWREQPTDKAALAGELADVGLYLLQLARVADIDLEQAMLDKLAKNLGRNWDSEV